MASMNPRYETKWQKARRMFNAKMKAFDNNGSKAIEFFSAQALKYQRIAKEQPQSVAGHRARYAHNAATYGINLAFGTDLAK
jgi:hypothetical protein